MVHNYWQVLGLRQNLHSLYVPRSRQDLLAFRRQRQ